jgi:carboxymethylenebutenolidase
MAELVTLSTIDGPMPAYIAAPSGDATGAIVVVQEAFGLTSHIEDICRRLAAAGFTAVAPALFHRDGSPVLSYTDMGAVMPVMKTLTAEGIATDVDAAFDFLAGEGFVATNCGIVGFCMGGSVAFYTATRRPLGAAVTFYGGGIAQGRFGFPPQTEVAAQLQTPWLGLYGDLDQGIPPDQVERLRAAVATAGVPTEIVRYPDAAHGFNCDERDSYHEPSAADAWQRTLDHFTRYLR